MKIFTLFLISILSLNLWALEVGDTGATTFLNHRNLDGSIQNENLLTIEEGKKFMLLEFMSITCSHCIRNMPLVYNLVKDIKDEVTVKLVSIDRSVRRVEDFIESNNHQINYPFVFDNQRIMKKSYDVIYVPTIMVFDENYTIIFKHIGALSPEIEEKIKGLFL